MRAAKIENTVRLSVVVLVVTGFLYAQTGAAAANTQTIGEITAHGQVALNGQPAITGGSLFSGDHIVTKKNSTAAMALIGGREIIEGSAGSVIVKGDTGKVTVSIAGGLAEVLSPASAPVEIEAQGVQVVPGAAGGIYIVQVDGRKLTVTAKKGMAEIESANRIVKVIEGMRCEAELGTVEEATGQGTAALKTPILTFAIVSAAMLAAPALSVVLAEQSANCQLSPSAVGNCEPAH